MTTWKMTEGDPSTSPWNPTPAESPRRRPSKALPSEHSSNQSETDLALHQTKSSSTAHSRSRHRRRSTPGPQHAFTLEELPDVLLDTGYDADIEIVHPAAYDEPDSDPDSATAPTTPAAQLTERLQKLQLRTRSRAQRRAKQPPPGAQSMKRAAAAKTHKRGFSESFESDSDFDGSGATDAGSPHSAKRSRRGHRRSLSSLTFTPLEYGSSPEVHGRVVRGGAAAELSEALSRAPDAMDVDEEPP